MPPLTKPFYLKILTNVIGGAPFRYLNVFAKVSNSSLSIFNHDARPDVRVQIREDTIKQIHHTQSSMHTKYEHKLAS